MDQVKLILAPGVFFPLTFNPGDLTIMPPENHYLCDKCKTDFKATSNGDIFCPVCNPSPKDVKTQKHYTQFKIQPAAFIAANNLGYCEGNVIKYVCRYKLKNRVEDLKKAQHYLEMLIEKVETGEVKL